MAAMPKRKKMFLVLDFNVRLSFISPSLNCHIYNKVWLSQRVLVVHLVELQPVAVVTLVVVLSAQRMGVR